MKPDRMQDRFFDVIPSVGKQQVVDSPIGKSETVRYFPNVDEFGRFHDMRFCLSLIKRSSLTF